MEVVMAPRTRFGCCRPVEVIRMLVAACFGFSLHMVLESTRLQCPQCADCSAPDQEHDIFGSGVRTQLREQFKPKNMYDVIRYDYFNASAIFNNFDDDPRIGLLQHQKSDIREIVSHALILFSSAKGKTWKMSKLVNGYRRFDGLRGEEYVLDMMVVPQNSQEQEKETHAVLHRFELVKPFGAPHLVSFKQIHMKKMVHIILPVSGRIDRFQQFMSHYETTCLQTNEHVYLLVVLFMGQDDKARQQAEQIRTVATNYHIMYHRSHIRVIQTNKPYSRALGISLGTKQLPDNALMFFCDTDVLFSRGFLDRCRNNAVKDEQVFYPIVFAQYNPEIVLKYSPKGKMENRNHINKYTGHWVHYGFGMVCLYTDDYRTVGGFNMNIKGWGGEDVDLYKKHVRSNIAVFRATDPGLVHIYHNKTCDTSLKADQYRMCVDSMAEGHGSKQQLAKLVLLQERAEMQRK